MTFGSKWELRLYVPVWNVFVTLYASIAKNQYRPPFQYTLNGLSFWLPVNKRTWATVEIHHNQSFDGIIYMVVLVWWEKWMVTYQSNNSM